MKTTQDISINPFEVLLNELHDLREMVAVLDHRLKNDKQYNPDLIHIARIDELYGIARSTIYTYHREGNLKLYKYIGKTYISKRELEAEIRKYPIPKRGFIQQSL